MIGIESERAVRALARIVFIIIFLSGACNSPTGPNLKGGVLATFDVGSERYSIFITNTVTINQVYALKNGQSTASIPNGLVVRGAESYNKPWSWHIDSEKVSMVDITAEINDGSPSGVEADLDSWVGRYFGPWNVTLISVKDYH